MNSKIIVFSNNLLPKTKKLQALKLNLCVLFENAHKCGLYEFSHIYQAMLMGIMGVESSVRIVLCTVYDENGDVFPLSPYYMRLQMVFVDSWSAVMIVLTVVQIIISVLAIKNKNNKKVVVE